MKSEKMEVTGMKKEKIWENRRLEKFRAFLREEEKSERTVEKYMRDLNAFGTFIGEGTMLEKQKVIEYKKILAAKYRVSSVNSILVALNRFFDFCGFTELKVHLYHVQKSTFESSERNLTMEEYRRLVQAAFENGCERIGIFMQAICSTGLRVSEHRFITVESLKKGYLEVHNKGKHRIVLLTKGLEKLLTSWCRRQGILTGPVFVSSHGNPLDRSNIWREMKRICGFAGVEEEKVYPHNLRHLFARTYYEQEKDLLRLAEILGHSSIETTRIYTKTTLHEQKRVLSALGLLIGTTKEWKFKKPVRSGNDRKKRNTT